MAHRRKQIPEIEVLLRSLIGKQNLMNAKLEKIMATMVDLTAAVARNTSAENSVIELLKGISEKLKEAQAANDPTAIQSVIDQIDANTAAAAAAVVANTPTAPTPA